MQDDTCDEHPVLAFEHARRVMIYERIRELLCEVEDRLPELLSEQVRDLRYFIDREIFQTPERRVSWRSCGSRSEELR